MPEGFSWIDPNDADHNVFSFIRWSREREPLVCLCNFSPVVGKDHQVGLPRAGRWVEILNTDDAAYGGSDVPDMGVVEAEETRLGRSARIGPGDPAAPSDRLADPKLRARKIRGWQAWVVQCRSANGTTPGQEAGRRTGLRALDRSLTVRCLRSLGGSKDQRTAWRRWSRGHRSGDGRPESGGRSEVGVRVTVAVVSGQRRQPSCKCCASAVTHRGADGPQG